MITETIRIKRRIFKIIVVVLAWGLITGQNDFSSRQDNPSVHYLSPQVHISAASFQAACAQMFSEEKRRVKKPVFSTLRKYHGKARGLLEGEGAKKSVLRTAVIIGIAGAGLYLWQMICAAPDDFVTQKVVQFALGTLIVPPLAEYFYRKLIFRQELVRKYWREIRPGIVARCFLYRENLRRNLFRQVRGPRYRSEISSGLLSRCLWRMLTFRQNPAQESSPGLRNAIIISAMIFSASFAPAYVSFNPGPAAAFIPHFLLGILLASVYVRFRSLIAAALVHGLANAVMLSPELLWKQPPEGITGAGIAVLLAVIYFLFPSPKNEDDFWYDMQREALEKLDIKNIISKWALTQQAEPDEQEKEVIAADCRKLLWGEKTTVIYTQGSDLPLKKIWGENGTGGVDTFPLLRATISEHFMRGKAPDAIYIDPEIYIAHIIGLLRNIGNYAGKERLMEWLYELEASPLSPEKKETLLQAFVYAVKEPLFEALITNTERVQRPEAGQYFHKWTSASRILYEAYREGLAEIAIAVQPGRQGFDRACGLLSHPQPAPVRITIIPAMEITTSEWQGDSPRRIMIYFPNKEQFIEMSRKYEGQNGALTRKILTKIIGLSEGKPDVHLTTQEVVTWAKGYGGQCIILDQGETNSFLAGKFGDAAAGRMAANFSTMNGLPRPCRQGTAQVNSHNLIGRSI